MMGVFTTSTGKGADIVVIHGWTLDHQWVQPIVDQLSSDFCVTSLDLPGIGQSDWVSDIKDIHGIADQLLPLLPDEAIYIACSIGGPVAISIAARYPHRVLHLIGVGTMPKFISGDDWIGVPQPGFRSSFGSLIETKGLQSVLQTFCQDEFSNFDPKPPAYHRLLSLVDKTIPDLDAIYNGLTIVDNTDLRREFASLSCQIDLIFGQYDEAVPIAACNQIKLLSPKANIHIIDGARHLPFWTHGKEFQKVLDNIMEGRKNQQHSI
ncbi:MAG: alpha/beta fold hydrolase [Desulfobacteraceae bacterium]|nr:alpha/beta fold hydrolase [Desulfobacteraceae bacterium]